jgi:hypothetical protein
MTNDDKLNSYLFLFRFKLRDNDLCQYCLESRQTAEHLIYDCSKYEEQTSQLKVAIEATGIVWPTSHQQPINKGIYSYFIEYCKEILN